MTSRPTPATHARTRQEPDPTSVWGVIYSMVEGIALAIFNKAIVMTFTVLAQVQQQLSPQNPAFNLELVFNAYGVAYFLVAFVVPVAAAYHWADLTGVGVYGVGWLATTIILSGAFTIGSAMLFAAILIAIIVDILKHA